MCREAAAGKELRTRTGGARKMQRKNPDAASSNSGNSRNKRKRRWKEAVAKRETERKEFKREGAPRDGATEANKLCLTRGTTS